MKKKLLSLFFCIAFILIFISTSAFADSGPKPSVVIDFKGLDGKSYYVTLLSDKPSTGPHSSITEDPSDQRYKENDKDYNVWKKFVDYKDSDGYYFLQYFEDCTKTSEFKWGYYPPTKFKILIYFPENDSFLISRETFEKYAFDSYFTATVNNSSLTVSSLEEPANYVMSLEKSYNYNQELSLLFLRIILTIIIEVVVALIFGLKKKKLLRFIVLINVITQTLLNILLNIINYKYGGLLFVTNYVLLELLVVVIETAAYYIYFKKYSFEYNIKTWTAPVYALCANAVSFIIGIYITYLVSAIK